MDTELVKRTHQQALAYLYLVEDIKGKPFSYAVIGDTSVMLAPAVYGTIAFGCELLIKALLYLHDHTVSDVRREISHDLLSLYNALPLSEKKAIEANINLDDSNSASFQERLAASKDAFVKLRYANETDGYSFDFIFLIALSASLNKLTCARLKSFNLIDEAKSEAQTNSSE